MSERTKIALGTRAAAPEKRLTKRPDGRTCSTTLLDLLLEVPTAGRKGTIERLVGVLAELGEEFLHADSRLIRNEPLIDVHLQGLAIRGIAVPADDLALLVETDALRGKATRLVASRRRRRRRAARHGQVDW